MKSGSCGYRFCRILLSSPLTVRAYPDERDQHLVDLPEQRRLRLTDGVGKLSGRYEESKNTHIPSAQLVDARKLRCESPLCTYPSQGHSNSQIRSILRLLTLIDRDHPVDVQRDPDPPALGGLEVASVEIDGMGVYEDLVVGDAAELGEWRVVVVAVEVAMTMWKCESGGFGKGRARKTLRI